MKAPVVGILGGGQLARMLILAGTPLGARFQVLDSCSDACAGALAPLEVADWQDRDALQRLARAVDVITFDFENVPADAAEAIAASVPVFPQPNALAIAQDRLAEKALFAEIGLATPTFSAVSSRAELDTALQNVGVPAILKTRRLGYDGKGQFRLYSLADADRAWAALSSQAAEYGLILEALVAFESEISVLAVRGRDGEFRTWPLTRNWHTDGVLSLSLAPAPGLSAEIEAAAVEHTRALAERLEYVGVLALELFLDQGCLLGNEMAPRVHNSGHWSIEGAHCSQFENHLRAVLGLPLGDTGQSGQACMLNWIGSLPDMATFLREADAHWHDYGKSSRPGRKVGHATICASDPSSLRVRLQRIGRTLGREAQLAPVLTVLAQTEAC